MALLLDWLIQPLGLCIAGMVVGLLLLLRQSAVSPPALCCLSAATLILWAASAPITANAFVRHLETLDDEATQVCDALQGNSPIVVPGAGMDSYVDSDNPYEVLSRDTLLRTLHAIRLDEGTQTFYLLGGGQTPRKLADFMSRVLIEQGIAAERIVVETKSLSTRENASEFAALAPPDDTPPIRLVTSYLHGNRAYATFHEQGFRVCTVAVDPLYSVSAGWVGYLPFLDALTKSTHAWRELMAIWFYDWHGYSTSDA